MNGLDVSRINGHINFYVTKRSGIEFVVIRAGAGSQKDPFFELNYTRGRAAGLHVGAYWLSYAETPDAARAEAAACAEVLKEKQFDFPIFYALENDPARGYFPFVQDKEKCSELVSAFCNELEKAGYFVGLYISRAALQNHITAEVAERYTLWLAEYGEKLNYKGKFGIWQHSTTGRVVGVIGEVNLDTAKTDFSKIIIPGGYNGYKTEPAPEYIEHEVKKGDTITAIAKKYGTTIQAIKKINDIQKINVGDVLKIPDKG